MKFTSYLALLLKWSFSEAKFPYLIKCSHMQFRFYCQRFYNNSDIELYFNFRAKTTYQEIKILNVELRISIIKTKNELQHMSTKFQKILINKIDEFRNQIKG